MASGKSKPRPDDDAEPFGRMGMSEQDRETCRAYLRGRLERSQATLAKFKALPRSARNPWTVSSIAYWTHNVRTIEWLIGMLR